MLLNKKIDYDDGKLIIHKQFANDPYLRRSELIREINPDGVVGESRFVGSIPMHLLAEWLKEAGVRWDDTHAAQEVVKKKMLSGEFDKIRHWKGNY